MSKKSVFCIATSREQANQIVDQLKAAQFSNRDISALFADKESGHDFAHEKNTKAPEGAVAGAGTGGILGGALGWIAGIGALAIPGVGPFIAAGPIMAALGGAAVGATVGGITGALIGMGIPELEAKRYEGKLKEGNILISVHTENSEEIDRAKAIFDQAGAEDICTVADSSVPDPSKDKMRHEGRTADRVDRDYAAEATGRTSGGVVSPAGTGRSSGSVVSPAETARRNDMAPR